ncbi:MAG TPA: hypothetical protein VFX76_18775 [Roseiflexaceae bacterium]|jgi:hypothetical protein|nr:hypothetical protein [Roseiflexaceae bacterium]
MNKDRTYERLVAKAKAAAIGLIAIAATFAAAFLIVFSDVARGAVLDELAFVFDKRAARTADLSTSACTAARLSDG